MAEQISELQDKEFVVLVLSTDIESSLYYETPIMAKPVGWISQNSPSLSRQKLHHF